MAANVGHNGTGRVAEPVGAHEEWSTDGEPLVAQYSCRLCLVCTRIRWPGLNLIFFGEYTQSAPPLVRFHSHRGDRGATHALTGCAQPLPAATAKAPGPLTKVGSVA